MTKLALLAFTVLFLWCSLSSCQRESPTDAQFTATLQSVIAGEPRWRKTIQVVDMEQLPVDYATGKLYETTKNLVSQDLDVAVRWATRAQSEHSLFAEVNFLSSIQALQSDMSTLVGFLAQLELSSPAARKKVDAWSDGLNGLADGPVSQAWKISFLHTTHRASLIDQSCVVRSNEKP